METLDIDGVRFVRASVAAKQFGYTADYVGQLARAGKISAKQVGRVWYVEDGELNKHKTEHVRSNKEKTREALRVASAEANSHQIHHVLYTPHGGGMPEFRKRLMDAPVRYETDRAPISINVSKQEEAPRSENLPSVTQKEAEIPISHEPTAHLHILTNERESEPEVKEFKEEQEISLHPKSESRHEMRVATHEPPRSGVLEIEEIDPVEDVEPLNEAFIRLEDEAEPTQAAFLKRLKTYETVPAAQPVRKQLTAVPLRNVRLEGPSPLAFVLPVLILAALCFSISSVFLENVWVYSQGEGATRHPIYETSYGVRAVSAVAEGLMSH